nr:MAG TPA: hypothetical protein [Caudoviricetes sp.]
MTKKYFFFVTVFRLLQVLRHDYESFFIAHLQADSFGFRVNQENETVNSFVRRINELFAKIVDFCTAGCLPENLK